MGQDARIQFLSQREVPEGDRVLYWMQASVRSTFNHALEYALHLARHRRQPLEIVFGLTGDYPGARLRHYRFLLEGLEAVQRALAERGLPFRVHLGDPADVALAAARRATTIVTDRGYTRIQREWRERVAAEARCPVVQVESNVVVPVDVASDKEEYSAATIRRKIQPRQEEYLSPVSQLTYEMRGREDGGATGQALASYPVIDLRRLLEDRDELCKTLGLEDSVSPVDEFRGGEDQARRHLTRFLERSLTDYDQSRNPPDLDATSHLSPYLHFGHISPVEIALRAMEAAEHGPARAKEGLAAFLEELIVRRELAVNFVVHNEHYDRFDCLPSWAVETLREHSGDERPALYEFAQLENAGTDDPYWNACQNEMRVRGRMHGYMRMYWGKRILEWHQDPEEAYAVAVRLNDTWELDGRDPNGYAGVAWCFGKHDRPWVERPVFGKVRYMNANGLRRKFKGIDAYVARWAGNG